MKVVKVSILGVQTTWVFAYFACWLLTQLSVGQDRQFKLELFDRGVEQLRLESIKAPVDIENALEAAFAIDSDKLPQKLVTKLGFSMSLAFRVSVNAAHCFPDLKPILGYLPQEQFTRQDAASIAKLAFVMGTRREDLLVAPSSLPKEPRRCWWTSVSCTTIQNQRRKRQAKRVRCLTSLKRIDMISKLPNETVALSSWVDFSF